jgi:hypothetical protein
MPAMADVVVKADDGTTNVTYTQKSPSAGNSVPAIWRNDSVGNATGQRPEFRLLSKDSGDGKSRVLQASYSYKQVATDSTTSVSSVVNEAKASASWTMPNGMAAADINQFAAQFGNLIAATLVKTSVQQGFAPT